MSGAVRVRPVPPELTRPLRQAVLRPHETVESLAAHESEDTFAVAAFETGEIIGVGFVVPEGGPNHWRVRGMATEPQARGRGIGTAILDALIVYAREQGAERIWCKARTPARSLYERAGFVAVSEQFEVPNIGPHLIMELR